MPQELAGVVLYSQGGDNEDGQEIPEMENVDLIFEA